MGNVNYTYLCDDALRIEFNPISRRPQHWTAELLNTASIIKQQSERPIVLALSGGIDGEVAALSLLKNNIDFSAISIRHVAGTNMHDIRYAIDFCAKNNIQHHIVDIDYQTFLDITIEKYIEQGYKATNVFRYLQLFIIDTVESMGGRAILGGGEQIFNLHDGEICVEYSAEHLVPLEYCRRNKVDHIPYFHLVTPELLASYLNIDLVDFLLKTPLYFRTPTYRLSIEKILVYHAYWDMVRRPKFHGFERVGTETQQKIDNLMTRFPGIPTTFIPVTALKQQLGMDKFTLS